MKKIISFLAVMALITASFTGCNDTGKDNESSKKSSNNAATTTARDSEADTNTIKDSANADNSVSESKATTKTADGDYKLPESTELVIYQNGKEIFRYNGETMEEVASFLSSAGAKQDQNKDYVLVEDFVIITVDEKTKDISANITFKEGITATVDGIKFETTTECYEELLALYGKDFRASMLDWAPDKKATAEVQAITNKSNKIVLAANIFLAPVES